MHDDGKSDRPIVPKKPTNNSGHGEASPHPAQPPAESVEGRGRAAGRSPTRLAPIRPPATVQARVLWPDRADRIAGRVGPAPRT